MTNPDDEALEQQYRDFQNAQEFARPAIRRAERIYTQCVNGIWIGNAGAAIALLSFIGAIAHDYQHLAVALLWPIALFVFGLIFMGVGAAVALVREGARAKRLEILTHILDAQTGDGQKPTEAMGLTLRDPRTIGALVGTAFFVIGCIWELFDLACMVWQ